VSPEMAMNTDILQRSVAHPFIHKVNLSFGNFSQWILKGNINKDLLKEVRHSYPERCTTFFAKSNTCSTKRIKRLRMIVKILMKITGKMINTYWSNIT